jgi:hypothetical protein
LYISSDPNLYISPGLPSQVWRGQVESAFGGIVFAFDFIFYSLYDFLQLQEKRVKYKINYEKQLFTFVFVLLDSTTNGRHGLPPIINCIHTNFINITIHINIINIINIDNTMNNSTNSVSDYIEIQTPLKGYYGLVRQECRTFMSGAALAAESGSVNPVRN